MHLWWGLALVLEVAWPNLVVPLGATLAPCVDTTLLALAAAVALLLVSGVPVPRSPPSPVTWPNGQNETHGIALLDYRGRAIPVIAQLTHGAGATQRHRYDVAQGRIAERKAG